MKTRHNIKRTIIAMMICALALCAMPHQAEAATVKPAKAVVRSLSSTNQGDATIKLKKISGATGYQVCFAKNKGFKNGSFTVKTTKTTVKTTKAQTGTKYYVKARAYKKYGSKTVYGKWSNPRAVFVKPGKASITSVKSNAAGKAAITFKKKTGSVTGYQIRYSTNKNFKNAKTVKNNGTSKTISGLTGGKTYYFSVRQYKNYNGKTHYGAWSGTKSVTVKKAAPATQTASGQSGTDTGTSSSGSQTSGSTEPQHIHDWQPVHTEKQVWVTDEAAWDETVSTDHILCSQCGQEFATVDDAIDHNIETAHSYYIDTTQETIHHDEQGHYETTQELTGYKCSCGAETDVENHTHDWQPVYTENHVWVVDEAAWDEEVIEYVTGCRVPTCALNFEAIYDEYKNTGNITCAIGKDGTDYNEEMLACAVWAEETFGSGFNETDLAGDHNIETAHTYGTIPVTTTIHHNEQGHYETTRELTGYRCGCGEIK